MDLEQIPLYWRSMRHYTMGQILGKTAFELKSRAGFCSRRRQAALESIAVQHKAPFLFHDPWNDRDRMLRGRFTFLDKTLDIGFPPDWEKPDSLLWTYNLHYMNYLYLLNPDERATLFGNWIERAKQNQIAWQPYVTSVRLRNLLKFSWEGAPFIDSLFTQADFLYHNLELFLHGNHVLENAFALIFAGVAFPKAREAGRWYARGTSILYDQLPKQILPDGFHYEKSPMYHQIMLVGLLDIMNVVQVDKQLTDFVAKYVSLMLEFSLGVASTGGRLPLLNDCAYEIAPGISQVVECARHLGLNAGSGDAANAGGSPEKMLHSSGYFVYRNQGMDAVFDFGSIGPDDVPAHAHADIFTYEVTLHGTPMIVDSGTTDYGEKSTREYFRSTRAHNTVTVDRRDQAEMWGVFRVARRFEPEDVRTFTDGKQVCLVGTFTGYSVLIGDSLSLTRTVTIDAETNEITVDDRVKGIGHHRIESFVHLNPECAITTSDTEISLVCGEQKLLIRPVGCSFSVEDGLYSPRMGGVARNKVLVLSAESLPANLSYKIIPII